MGEIREIKTRLNNIEKDLSFKAYNRELIKDKHTDFVKFESQYIGIEDGKLIGVVGNIEFIEHAKTDIEFLLSKLEKQDNELKSLACENINSNMEVVKLKSKLEKAKGALEFYANSENHDREGIFEHKTFNSKNQLTDYWVDYGFTAREALKELEGLND